jgi:predicted AAA+ superfamily ATPase
MAGYRFDEAQADREHWGRLTESAVGAHLTNAAAVGDCEVFYWRERNREVDFVVRAGRKLVAIEVKSGRAHDALPGMQTFNVEFKPDRLLLVGGDGIPVEDFLCSPLQKWLAG